MLRRQVATSLHKGGFGKTFAKNMSSYVHDGGKASAQKLKDGGVFDFNKVTLFSKERQRARAKARERERERELATAAIDVVLGCGVVLPP